MTETLKSLTDRAGRLKAERRLDKAVALYAQAADAYPSSAVARHNLAGALGDAGRDREAEAEARRAMAMGLDAPETWLVLARSLVGLGRLDEAESAFSEALSRRPSMAVAHQELAQLRWMRTGDGEGSLADLDRAAADAPLDADIQLARLRAIEYAKGEAIALKAAEAALAGAPGNASLLAAASLLATKAGDAERAVELAMAAVRGLPGDSGAISALAFACLAAGNGEGAAEAAIALLRSAPHDQQALAALATAWRLQGDPRYGELYDYAAFVRPWRLATPEGWTDLDAYLTDLGAALRRRHPFKTHPFGHSVRQGSQLANLLQTDEPAIKAFPQALAPAVDAHLAAMGSGPDPLRARNTGRWRFAGIWSVWLRPGGFHADHVHQQGWLSSACYVELPAAVGAGGQEGWIKFGEPGLPTRPKLEAEHAVRPEPGTVVLFPSYMWHGTIPFSGDEPRLTIAFDIMPA
jgi:tetratricopeptide (TPR) repeat protein